MNIYRLMIQKSLKQMDEKVNYKNANLKKLA